jgi:cytochrome c biogenesis protein CcdA
MSKSGTLGFALTFSALGGLIWYALSSFMLHWEHFQVWAIVGFTVIALLGLVLFWDERRAFRQTKQLTQGTGFATVGAILLGLGFAWFDAYLGPLLWVILGAGFILYLVGTAIAWNGFIPRLGR